MNGIFDDLKNAFKQQDNSLVQIILVNVLIFVIINCLDVILTVFFFDKQTYLFIKSQLLLPASLPKFLYHPWTILSYAFVHESFMHILFNMLFLYWFGKLIQEYLGSKRVVSLYILGGIVGGVLYMALYNLVPFYHNRVATSEMLGASAGVYAIVTAAATLVPNYTFHLLFLGPVRIKYIALVYILLSFFGIKEVNAGGNIAHLGGALLGFIFIASLRKGNDLGTPIHSVIDWIASLFQRRKLKVAYKPPKEKVATAKSYGKANQKSTSNTNIPNQDEIDAILDKISQTGYESLTKEEKQRLFNASKGN